MANEKRLNFENTLTGRTDTRQSEITDQQEVISGISRVSNFQFAV